MVCRDDLTDDTTVVAEGAANFQALTLSQSVSRYFFSSISQWLPTYCLLSELWVAHTLGFVIVSVPIFPLMFAFLSRPFMAPVCFAVQEPHVHSPALEYSKKSNRTLLSAPLTGRIDLDLSSSCTQLEPGSCHHVNHGHCSILLEVRPILSSDARQHIRGN
jgi:hypothetical protein